MCKVDLDNYETERNTASFALAFKQTSYTCFVQQKWAIYLNAYAQKHVFFYCLIKIYRGNICKDFISEQHVLCFRGVKIYFPLDSLRSYFC